MEYLSKILALVLNKRANSLVKDKEMITVFAKCRVRYKHGKV